MKRIFLAVCVLLLAGCTAQKDDDFKVRQPSNDDKINNIEAHIGVNQADALRVAGDRDKQMEDAMMQIEMEGRK